MSNNEKHAILSPSGAHRWSRCIAAPKMEQAYPRKSSKYADEGTLAHKQASDLMMAGKYESADEHIQSYLDYVLRETGSGLLLVEQRLSIENITGELDAKGTADAVILGDSVLKIIDLKYGIGEKVDARDNEQLMVYAYAAMEQYDWWGDFHLIEMHIVQPRINHYDNAIMSATELKTRIGYIRERAAKAFAILNGKEKLEDSHFSPGKKQCRWCAASGNCPAQTKKIYDDMALEFENLDAPLSEKIAGAIKKIEAANYPRLAANLRAIDFVKDWIKAIQEKAHSILASGGEVRDEEGGFKLVRGKNGRRKYDVPDDKLGEIIAGIGGNDLVEKLTVKSWLSPAKAQTALKRKNPEQWEKLNEHILSPPGKLEVAPDSDPRPSEKPDNGENDFEELDEE